MGSIQKRRDSIEKIANLSIHWITIRLLPLGIIGIYDMSLMQLSSVIIVEKIIKRRPPVQVTVDYYKITFLFLGAFILYEIRLILFAGSSHSTNHTKKKLTLFQMKE